MYSSLEDTERLGGSVSGDGVRRDAQPDFVDRQQRLGRGRKEPLQVRSRSAAVKFTASVACLMKLFSIVKITTLGGAVAEWSKTLLVRENKRKSKRSQVRPPTWEPLKKITTLATTDYDASFVNYDASSVNYKACRVNYTSKFNTTRTYDASIVFTTLAA